MNRNPNPYKRPTLGRKPKKVEIKSKRGKTAAPTPQLSILQRINAWISPWTRKLSPLTKRVLMVLIGGFLFGGLISYFSGINIQQSLLRALIFGVVVTLFYLLMEWSITTAEKKGYSWWLGLLLFLVPPLLGMVVILLLPRKSKAEA